MNVGNSIYTEYEYDSEFINYRMENPNNLNCDLGHIHSHHTMETFFSGTDMRELHDNAPNHNYYLSLIVNNSFTPTAKIAFKGERMITKKEVTSFFDANGRLIKSTSNTEAKEEVLFIYDCDFEYNMEINVEDSFKTRVNNLITEYNQSLAAIKPAAPVYKPVYKPVTKPVEVEEVDEYEVEELLISVLEGNYYSTVTIDEALNSAEAKWKLSPDTYFNSFETQLTTALKLYYTDLTIEDAIDDIVEYLYDNYEDSGFIKELITNLFILNYDNKQI